MVWRGPEFAVTNVPDPEFRSDEVLIRVRACGICGSDVHIYERDADGYMLYPGMIGLPADAPHDPRALPIKGHDGGHRARGDRKAGARIGGSRRAALRMSSRT
jgi:threonine dehydrogenase-like Zn-dependent dehydrogenase